jgi:hypothetical protein
MQTKRTINELDFNDNTVLEIHIAKSNVVVVLQHWTEQRIELEFFDYLTLIDRGAVEADICAVDTIETSEFLNQTLTQADIRAGREYYSHFCFISGWDGNPILEIVSKGVKVRKGTEY